MVYHAAGNTRYNGGRIDPMALQALRRFVLSSKFAAE
jgi:hypothetical protein